MTALAILSLRDAGKVVLDAPLAEYVPQFAMVKSATADSKPVTVRDLLCHVAGFVTDDPWGDRVLGMTPAALDELVATGALFARAPGLAYEYSNLGYALLGRVLTNVSGEPYQDYMRRLFVAPWHQERYRAICVRTSPSGDRLRSDRTRATFFMKGDRRCICYLSCYFWSARVPCPSY
jgi:CubicO group peptidase (beta-lactamase class C family)